MASSLDAESPSETRPWRWFFGVGMAAVLIALFAVYVFHAPSGVIQVLVPTAVLFFNPAPLDLPTRVVLFFLIFGGTFLLYGTAGALLGHAIRAWRSWTHRPSSPS